MRNKAKEHREERKNKKKLLEDFNYIIESNLNSWFKRVFLTQFIDSWIDKSKDAKYDDNIFWSKRAIEKKIQNKINTENEDYKLNNDHLVPRVIFEDIFIDGKKLDMSKKYKLISEKRTLNANKFYNKLRERHNDLNQEEFLEMFFNEFCISVTLTKEEHDNLYYWRSLPDEFYKDGNRWIRYKYLKNDEKGKIEIYETDFRKIQNIDRNSITFEGLHQEGIVSHQIDFEKYVPIN